MSTPRSFFDRPRAASNDRATRGAQTDGVSAAVASRRVSRARRIVEESACWVVAVGGPVFVPKLLGLLPPPCKLGLPAPGLPGLVAVLWLAMTVVAWVYTSQRSMLRGVGIIVLTLVMIVWVPLMSNPHAYNRIAKVQADTRSVGSAVTIYREHTGRLPETLDELTEEAVNARGQRGGPFMNAVPTAPHGWMPYRYVVNADDTFVISTWNPETSQSVDSNAVTACVPDRAR
jgi:hypothetical protein